MGVAGCGKSSLGAAVASQAGLAFIEGDTFHSPQALAKMRAGIPLSDADRTEWLDRLEPPSEDERFMLGNVAAERRSNSRLCCQIVLEPALDGLRVQFPERQS